jgi:hypothetical protein
MKCFTAAALLCLLPIPATASPLTVQSFTKFCAGDGYRWENAPTGNSRQPVPTCILACAAGTAVIGYEQRYQTNFNASPPYTRRTGSVIQPIVTDKPDGSQLGIWKIQVFAPSWQRLHAQTIAVQLTIVCTPDIPMVWLPGWRP